MEKYICIHGHFYQPPRENPWLEDVELQDSAYPYHDWNARIAEECYRQNAASRILSAEKKVVDIVNNYEHMSFNFGPTLLSWLESHLPDIHDKIVAADHASRERYSGHGAALAQPYNHMILPLSNSRDKHTQVIWGIRDFQRRFERNPEGMWLPETAVDSATLEVLVDHGIGFTILAPRQARRIRKLGAKRWRIITNAQFDTSVPYLCRLPSGRKIVLFFYNGPASQDIAYGGLLHSGENLAARLLDSFPREDGKAHLVHVATDGESFGHHHHHGDMALAYCLRHIEANHLARITVYAEFLERHPPEHEIDIWEKSSWSCAHGVERWKSNCGCAGDQARSGQQHWRAPLREAMDWLRDKLTDAYEAFMSQYDLDPWQLRNQYIHVLHDRSPENVEHFTTTAPGHILTHENQVAFLKSLEMQRNAMLMYTSCGWFFDNLSGIETVQVMQYADRAIQLCRDVQNWDLTDEFKTLLEKAPANVRPFIHGRDVYEARVEPARIDLGRVAAHLAISSLFENAREAGRSHYCYTTQLGEYTRKEAGVQVLTTSRVTIQSNITLEEQQLEFVVLYLGDHNLFAAVRGCPSDPGFEEIREQLQEAFASGDSNAVVHLMNVDFGGRNYSLNHLFRDQRRKILDQLLKGTWDNIENAFRSIYEHDYAIISMLRSMNMPLPKALSAPVEFVINKDLNDEIQRAEIDLDRLQELANEAGRLSLSLDKEKLALEGSQRIYDFVVQVAAHPDDMALLETVERTIKILRTLAPDMDLYNAQNVFFEVAQREYPKRQAQAQAENRRAAQHWLEQFRTVGDHLGLDLGACNL